MNRTLSVLALAACTGGGTSSTPTDTAAPEILKWGTIQCTLESSPPDGTEPTDEATLLTLLAGSVLPEHVVWKSAMDDLALESDIAWTLTPTGPATRAECGLATMLRVPVTITFDIDKGAAWGSVDVYVYADGPDVGNLFFLGGTFGTLELSDDVHDQVIAQMDPAATYEGTRSYVSDSFLLDPSLLFQYTASYPDYGGNLWTSSGKQPHIW